MAKTKYGISGRGYGKQSKVGVATEHPYPTHVNSNRWNPKEENNRPEFVIRKNHFYMLTLNKGMFAAINSMMGEDGECSFSFDIPENTHLDESYFYFGIIKSDNGYFGTKKPKVQISNGECTFSFSQYFRIEKLDPDWKKKFEEVFYCNLRIGELGLFDRVEQKHENTD